MEKKFVRYALLCAGFIFMATIFTRAQPAGSSDTELRYLIIRTDDIGMSHSVNMGLKKLLDTEFPISASVMFACPWYQEAVEILKQYPNTSVGVHLTLNSEWATYRWGPVAGQEAVPSLVDENGYFFHSSRTLYENNPDMQEVEKELRAQIERALRSGLTIDYVDYHMGTAVRDPEFRKVTEKLAREYGLGMFGYYESVRWDPQYRAAPEDKADSLVAMTKKLKTGYNYLVTHVGIDNDELGAMKDMNISQPLAAMSTNRQGELNALTSRIFRNALKEQNIQLITFGELIDIKGLNSMKRVEN